MKQGIRWAILGLLVTWGTISFLALAGGDVINDTTPLCDFLLAKSIALVSLIASYWVGGRLYKKGLLPDIKD